MNRLEKLKLELAQERRHILTGVREILPIDDIVVDEFYNGFDAASAEYEKIIAELEWALEHYEDIAYIKCDGVDSLGNEIENEYYVAEEALQKLKEFRGGE